jgi:hypothetical protein
MNSKRFSFVYSSISDEPFLHFLIEPGDYPVAIRNIKLSTRAQATGPGLRQFSISSFLAGGLSLRQNEGARSKV